MAFIRLCCLALLIALGSLSCSGTKAVIIDSSNLQTPVSKLRLMRNGDFLEIIEGEGRRTVPVSSIGWLKISPRETRNHEGKTYYLTEMELRDGSKIMSYRLKDGRRSRAYVCVDDTIKAKTPNGPIQVRLSTVAKITFE